MPLRRRVGLVFQFPEQQMFEDTVEKDLIFGPLNFGMSLEEAKARARQAMLDMGLDLALLERNPFKLSGGQMRKAAIASVLAMDPEVIVLDEPTATLDPISRAELIHLLERLCREQGERSSSSRIGWMSYCLTRTTGLSLKRAVRHFKAA